MSVPRILAIDGGGVRGLIPAMVLCEIERRTGRRTHELFDLIAGTSTGGIIAAFLSLEGHEAHEVDEFYTRECPKIFRRSPLRRGVLQAKFSPRQLERSLRGALGEARLSDAATDVVLPAFDINHHAPFFFKSSTAKADPTRDWKMWEAARATSAAPTFFPPMALGSGKHHLALVDGGVFANNPAICAYAEVCRGEAADALLVSVGTGRRMMSVEIARARRWGLAHWARPLLNMVFDGVSDTADYQLDQLLGERHVRFQAPLGPAADAFDDASPENMELLKEQGRALIAERSDDLDAVCAALSEQAPAHA